MFAQEDSRILEKLKKTSNLIAVWDFKEAEGQKRKAYGVGDFPLKEVGGTTQRINEGPLSGFSASFNGANFLTLPNPETGALNINGTEKEITVIAWVKWTGEQIGFVGGMWNEYKDGGKR